MKAQKTIFIFCVLEVYLFAAFGNGKTMSEWHSLGFGCYFIVLYFCSCISRARLWGNRAGQGGMWWSFRIVPQFGLVPYKLRSVDYNLGEFAASSWTIRQGPKRLICLLRVNWATTIYIPKRKFQTAFGTTALHELN